MKLIITNDDGYGQPGLAALIDAAASLGDLIVVAPATAQSNIGHRVTMREPIRAEQLDARTYRVHATPADCARLAIKQFACDADWLVAGINLGANLGSDVYQSGTVAAAREAAILGIRAMAVSQYVAPDWTVDWRAAAQHTARLLRDIVAMPLPAGNFWNVNLPSPITVDAPLAYRICPPDRHPHRYCYAEDAGTYRYQGIIHDRPRTAGSDVDVCFGGMISVTRLEI